MASPFNSSLYAWSPHAQDPNLFLRPALSVENKWVLKAQTKLPQVLLFLSGELSLRTPIQSSDFVEKAKRAWIKLRWLHPEICLGPYLPSSQPHDDGNTQGHPPKMCCAIPASEEEARAWADGSLTFDFARKGENGTRGNAIRGLRTRAAELKGERMPPVVARIAAKSEEKTSEDGYVRGVQYEVCVDHACTDGIGAHLIAGRYFALLAEQLGGGVERELDWGSCIDNLPQPWVEIMNREQRTGGAEFEKNVGMLQEKIDKYAKSDWGLTIRESGDRYEPSWLYFHFPENTTTAILRVCKEKLGISVTNLGHAATVLATLKGSNLADLPRDGLMCSLFINGRRYLDSEVLKSKPYLPTCRAMGFVEFTGIDKLALPEQPTKAETHKALLYASYQAQHSYQKIRDQTSILTESFAGSKYISMNKNICAAKAQPFFLSDGVTEQYIQRVYYDTSQSHEIFSVDEAQFIANPDGPPLVVRTSTFRNQLRLSAEWNKACYREEVIEDFIREVYLLMTSIS